MTQYYSNDRVCWTVFAKSKKLIPFIIKKIKHDTTTTFSPIFTEA
jgi:hypothetical protein